MGESVPADAPLAARMRPRTLEEFVGQSGAVGPGSILAGVRDGRPFPSIILWGPPGCGKTTLARLLARHVDADLVAVSAVSSGVAELRRQIEEARKRRDAGLRTTLFIDEIHRFNKAQQDVVLPHVEDGTVTLIGATTENPSFEVIAPLLSRVRVIRLEPLTDAEIATVVQRAIADDERGLGTLAVSLDEAAAANLIESAGGDARAALTALEIAAEGTVAAGRATIDPDDVQRALQERRPYYDKAGDYHFDAISAFIKSVRGSDPDATLYWLARMIEAGEDPLFIVRRMVILAAEDVGARRSGSALRSDRVPAGGALHRPARGLPAHGRVCDLSRARAQEQLRAHRLRPRRRGRTGDEPPPGAAPSTQRRDRPDARVQLWEGLPLRARRARPRCARRPLSPRRARRAALLCARPARAGA